MQSSPSGYYPGGFWCAVRSTDNLGVCMFNPGECEAFRGKNPGYQSCGQIQVAFCAHSGCFPNLDSCGNVERMLKRDGSGCSIRQR
jgi:hypothetical protein